MNSQFSQIYNPNYSSQFQNNLPHYPNPYPQPNYMGYQIPMMNFNPPPYHYQPLLTMNYHQPQLEPPQFQYYQPNLLTDQNANNNYINDQSQNHKNNLLNAIKSQIFDKPPSSKKLVEEKKQKIKKNKDKDKDKEKKNEENKKTAAEIEKDKKNQKANKAISELNDNLESFQFEFSRQIKNLKRAQDKINVNDLAFELDHMKQSHQENLEESKLRRKEDFRRFLMDIKNVRNQISEYIKEDYNTNRESFNNLKSEFDKFKNEINLKVQSIEENQDKEFEHVKFLYEQSGPGKPKIKIDHLTDDADALEKLKDGYLEPSKEEIKYALDQLKIKRRTTLFNMSEIEDMKKRRKNQVENIENEIKFRNKLTKVVNTNNFFEIIKVERIADDRAWVQNFNYVNKKSNYKLKGINKIRAFVYMLCYIHRFSFKKRENDEVIRSKTLEFFEKHYLTVEKEITIWMNQGIQDVLSELNDNKKLDLIIKESDQLQNENLNEDKYIKLETRIKKLFDALTVIVDKLIMSNSIFFIQILTTNGSLIPPNYLTFFERTRLEFNSDLTLKNLNDIKIKMIVSFFFIMRILIKGIFINQNYMNINFSDTLSLNNVKMIGSVIYYSLIDHFLIIKQDENSKTRAISNQFLVDFRSRFSKLKEKSGPKYNKLFKEHYYKLKKEIDEMCENDESLLKATEFNEKFLEGKDDNFDNEVSFIMKKLYPRTEMNTYFYFARKYNFDVTELALNFVEKICKQILG